MTEFFVYFFRLQCHCFREKKRRESDQKEAKKRKSIFNEKCIFGDAGEIEMNILICYDDCQYVFRVKFWILSRWSRCCWAHAWMYVCTFVWCLFCNVNSMSQMLVYCHCSFILYLFLHFSFIQIYLFRLKFQAVFCERNSQEESAFFRIFISLDSFFCSLPLLL